MDDEKVDINDVIMKYVGSFGRYQKVICYLLGFLGFVISFYAYDIVFTMASPDHWCTPPDLNGTKFFDLNQESHKILTVPRKYENGKLVFDSCHLFNVNFSNPALDYHDIADASLHSIPKRECNNYTFDHSTFKTTGVTEWGLVCNKDTLVATSQSFLMVGRFFGGFISGFLSDRFGRRPVLLFALVAFIPVRLMVSLAPNYFVFMIGSMFSGSLIISIYLVSFVLSMELVGNDWREFVGVLSAFIWGFGLMALSGIAYAFRDRQTLSLVLSIPTLLVVIYFIFVPESPRWLLTRKRKDDAVKVLRKMARVNKREIPFEILEKLSDSSGEELEKETFIDLVKCPVLLFRMLVLFLTWFSMNLAYVGLMLNTGNMAGSIYGNLAIGGLTESIAYFAAQFLMSRKWLGRRLVVSVSLILSGVSLLLTIAVPSDEGIYTTVLAQVGKMLVCVTYAVVYVYSAEMFPSSVRNSAMSALATVGKTAAIISPYVVGLGSKNSILPLIICGAVEIAAGASSFLLPETWGKKLLQTVAEQRQTESRVFWWKRNKLRHVPTKERIAITPLSNGGLLNNSIG